MGHRVTNTGVASGVRVKINTNSICLNTIIMMIIIIIPRINMQNRLEVTMFLKKGNGILHAFQQNGVFSFPKLAYFSYYILVTKVD